MSSRKNTKKNYQRKPASKQNSGSIASLMVGVLIGLLIAGLLYYKSQSKEKTHPAPKPIEVGFEDSPQPPKHKTIKHKTIKKNPETKTSEYEFYNLLSAQGERETAMKEEMKEEKVAESVPNKFLLEVAAFTSYAEADRLKAQLLLLGINEVLVSKGVKNHHPAYRVTVGPFNTRAQAGNAQKQLKENSIESTMLVG